MVTESKKDTCPSSGQTKEFTCSYCSHQGIDVHANYYKELGSQRQILITACDDIDGCIKRFEGE